MKKVLMIIPAYNEEKSIVKTVESINKIESKKYKIDYVVINDGSTDNTKKYVKIII
jgi:glycosyltransferase involved in cell wall biosynthesis